MGGRSSAWLCVALAGAVAACHDDAGHQATGDTSSGAGTPEGSSGMPTDSSSGDADGSSSGGEPVAPAVDAAPGGIRRLRADQYVATVRALLGPEAAAAALPPDDQSLSGFDSVGASSLPLSPAMVEQYEASALAIATVVADAPTQLSGYIPCVSSAQDEGCYVVVAEQFARIAWRRPVTSEEVDMLVDLARAARTTNADRFSAGLQFELALILQSPHFIYAVELGEPGDDGKRWLTTDEWVTRASLFVLGRAPDHSTIARIDAGELDTPEAQRALVAEMLERPEARIAVDRFFDELLRVREVLEKSKDPESFPLFTPALAASMREETLRLVRDAVFAEDGEHDVLRIFDADYTWVDPLLAELYGVPAPGSGEFERVTLPAAQGRLGVLAHPSLMAIGSHYDRNSPTRRGLFVQKTLLCNDVPPPPGDVDNTLPDAGEAHTLRERLEGHIAEGGPCTGCHAQMDPVGFAFEHYDAAGMRRELDNGFPIDASGSVEALGTFDGAAELALLVRDDPRVAPCLVRNLYRHAIGRVEDAGTADALGYLSDGFVAEHHDLLALIVQLVDNPAFRQVGEPQ